MSAIAVILPAGLAVGVFVNSAGAATDPVSAMSQPLYQRVNPKTSANLATPWQDEARTAASSYGFTVDLGSPFTVALQPTSGLVAVHRLYSPTYADFTWALAGSDALASAVSRGYVDQGVNFYASAAPLSSRTQAVQSYVKSNIHRLAAAETATALAGQGWRFEQTAFHVPATTVPPPTQATSTPRTPAPSTSTAPTSTTTPRTSTSTAPTSTTTPTTSTSTAPTSTTGATKAGSVPVGSAVYPLPSGSIYVAATGNDAATGSLTAPVRTIARAIALAPAGGTVVLRAGTYRENIVIQGKSVTLQNYPNEAAWLDGSQPVTGWAADGAVWRKDGWTTRFDSSPTYTQGAPDGTAENWRFVNAAYPMAAHPDQVYVDGAPLRQVQSRAQVTVGTFFLDTAASRLYIGTNPTGHTVDASTLIKALSIRSSGTMIRGIGIRRYSPSVFHVAAVTIEAQGVRLENVVVEGSATTGVGVGKPDAVLDRVTVKGSGMLGIQSRNADRIMLSSVLSTGNNSERFNIAPVSGGAKLTLTRGITVQSSVFSGNYGHGYWQDMSCFDTVIRGSSFMDNAGDGIFLEISAKAVVGDTFIARNKGFGIKVNNTSNVKIWNNTIVQNGRPLNIVQDARRNTNRSDPAVDTRRPWPDPEMPWTLGPVTVRNNVVADTTNAANCLLCVEDYSRQKSAEQMGITSNGNAYHRSSSSNPTWLAVWSRANVNVNPYVFTSLAALAATTGQEKRGREFVGSAIVDDHGTLASVVASTAAAVAEPLPADVASLIGRPVATRRLGRW